MYDGFEELDLVGPWEMATMWQHYGEGPSCFTLSETGKQVDCAKGLKVVPDYSFANVPQFDFLLVPGGLAAREQAKNAHVNAFLAEVAITAEAVLSVCTGALMLHAAGLLHDKRATTHWRALPTLRAFADVEVTETRFVHDGAIWTSAGVSAGIDMMLAFIADQAGAETAGIVQHGSEYYPDPVRYGSAAMAEGSPAYVRAAPMV